MRNMFLTLFFLFVISSCSENNSEQMENIVTENATVYYDASGVDNCNYTIKTESNNFYSVENLDETFRENNLTVKVSYTKTNERLNCGFSNNLIIIKIVTIEKI